jgi:excisionase family DNA binding protein
MEQLLTIKEVCDLFQVSPSLVYKWIHYQYIPYIKIGSLIRFKESEIIRWIKVKEKKGRNNYKIDVDDLVVV